MNALLWPEGRLAEAVEMAARHGGLVRRPSHAHAHARALRGPIAQRVESSALRCGIEAEPLDVAYGDLEARLFATAPLIVALGEPANATVAVVVGSKGRKLALMCPDLRVRHVEPRAVIGQLCASIEAPVNAEIDRWIAGVRRAESARRAILDEKLRAARVRGLFELRPPSDVGVREELARAGVWRRFAALLGAHAAQYCLWLLSWWVVGRASLDGRFEPGWFVAWALLLASLIPFRLLATWVQGKFAVTVGGILKQRLLAAALRLDPERVRGRGLGDFVGRVIESETVESLALGGGIAAVTAVLELVVAAFLLAFVPGGALLAFALVAWTALVLGCGAWCFARRRAWTSERLALSQSLIEKMVGHRTRLVQEPPETWHANEDAVLERYVDSSRRMDRATTWLIAVAARGWLLVGVLGLAPRILRGDASTPALAAELGGVLLAYVATNRLAHGIAQLGGAVIAWKHVARMLDESSREEAPGSVDVEPQAAAGDGERAKLLQVKDLGYRHSGRSEDLFRKLSLDVFEGDRILLEGPSGSGKSTLASLLTGLRDPNEGLVLLRGVDRGTIGGRAWRRRIAAAPQFHENHVFADTLAFNLLMGQRWPPREEDWKQAEELCGELGLSDLIARMPAGMNEIVGESGWQLSHGERSRLFMARALLQNSEVVVLDESFAALDPATLEGSMRCVLRRAKTLIVIAHP